MEQENQNQNYQQQSKKNPAKVIAIIIIVLAIIALVVGLVIKNKPQTESNQSGQNQEQVENVPTEKVNVLVGAVEEIESGYFMMRVEAVKNKGVEKDMLVKVNVPENVRVDIQSIPKTLAGGQKPSKTKGSVTDIKTGDSVTVKNFSINLSGKKEFNAESVSVKRIFE